MALAGLFGDMAVGAGQLADRIGAESGGKPVDQVAGYLVL